MNRFNTMIPLLTAFVVSASAGAADIQPAPSTPQESAKHQTSVDFANGYAYVPAGSALFLNEHGYCRVVEVAADAPDLPKGGSLVVPFRTPEEWKAFREHAPKSVALTPCCPAKTVVEWPLAPTLLESKVGMKLGVEYFTDTGIRGGIYPQPQPFQCLAEGQGADATTHWSAAGPGPVLPKPGEWKAQIYIPR